MLFSRLSSSQKNKLGLAAGIISMLGLGIFYATTVEKPLDEGYKPVYEYGGEFTLQSHKGAVSLSDFKNKVVVIYFGFLSCTEACPVSMSTMVGAIKKLTPAEREKLQVLFVSVDPERDDLKSLHDFSKHYVASAGGNPDIIMGLTGTKEDVDAVSKLYGVFFELVDLEGSGLGYTVDHSSRFYMVNTAGELVTTMNHSTTPIELAAKIRELQAEGVVKNTTKSKSTELENIVPDIKQANQTAINGKPASAS